MPKTQEDLFSDHKGEFFFGRSDSDSEGLTFFSDNWKEKMFLIIRGINIFLRSQEERKFFKWFLDIVQFLAMLVGYTGGKIMVNYLPHAVCCVTSSY